MAAATSDGKSSAVRLFLAAAAASALGVAALAPVPAASDNVLEIVIGNGPHAGTYKPPASTIMCIHFKQQKQVDLKKIGEAAINIFKSR